ncbi:hypothetical protein AVEN_159999-1 [Araneus ventricosus]|uniref:Tc1-like transposase DDE domain-containing protein n=1 Tax=Araneus ventricosus TaxID=182803 RepID=A0A4Y2QAH3_ARAVE|nr:hypothetical protein AVEN_159999-1 [Araneus ventricosus]
MKHLQPNDIFQQDGASPHWGTDVRAFLDTTFPNRWLRLGGLIGWPPRSPELTPLDFFFWDYVKVYSRDIRDFEDLRASIISTIATLTTEMLQRNATWLELDYMLDILKAAKDVHMEMH